MSGNEAPQETTRVRWAFHSTEQARTGTEEDIPTADVPWLVECGNVVVIGSQQDRDLEALRERNRDPALAPTPTSN